MSSSKDDFRSVIPVLLVAGVGAVVLACAACHGLAPVDAELERSTLPDLAAKLSQCRAEGRDAGSYEAYESCKRRRGIEESDGGVR